MRKNISSSLLIALCALSLWSCKAKKRVIATHPTVPVIQPENSNRAKINAIMARQISYNTFSGKAKTNLNIDGNTNDVTLNIRIQHGQKIWVSVTAIIGIEVARALITPDSILVINKLQSVYLKKPFSFIYTYANREVNFNTVESLLVGNAVPELLQPDARLQATADGGLSIQGNLQKLVYTLLLNPGLRVSQTSLADAAAGQSLKVNNSDFIQAGTRVIPSQITINSAVNHKSIQADLHYSRADFDQPLEYPFSIPDRYSPAN